MTPINPIPIHWDMETADPDDVMTLAILATHPRANLLGVTVTPGGPDQVALIRYVLDKLGSKALVGAGVPKPDKRYVSEFHYKWLGCERKMGSFAASVPLAEEVIHQVLMLHPETSFITGAKLTNIANYLRTSQGRIRSITVQGGFAGDSVVPPEWRLPKFAGRETCPTFNLAGDTPAAFEVVTSSLVGMRNFVSKNVCHGLAWDPAWHERVRNVPRTAGMDLVFEGMELYLQKKPEGKLCHDPFAACCALVESCAEWRTIELYREKGEWGSKLLTPMDVRERFVSNQQWAYITVKANLDEFFVTLTEV